MKKILAIFLLCGMVLSLCACPGGDGGHTGDNGERSDGVWRDSIGEYETETGKEYNFGGDSLSISCRNDYVYEIYAEAGSTESIDPMVYARNKRIEDRFNVKVKPVITVCKGIDDQLTHYEEVANAIKTNNVKFDLVSMWAYQSGKIILSGGYLDWRMNDGKGNFMVPFAGESIVNGAEWWPTSMNNPSSVLGCQYVAISDMCLTSYESAYAVVYNYDKVTNEGIPSRLGYVDMYDIVNKGDWTLTMMNDIVKDMHQESTTGGVEGKDVTDTFGLLISQATSIDAFIHSLGYNVLNNNGVDMPQLWNVDGNMVTTIEHLRAMCNSKGAWIGNGMTVTEYDQFFTEGHAYFASMKLERLRTSVLHAMEDDYGILPYPKLDKGQKEYITGSDDHYNVLSIPLDMIGRTEIIGVVIEALSAETGNTANDEKGRSLEGVFINEMIKVNSTRFVQDEDMVDKILNGRVYDLVTYHHADLLIDQTNASNHLHAFFRVLVNNPDKEVRNYWDTGEQILNGDENTPGSVLYLINRYINMYNQ